MLEAMIIFKQVEQQNKCFDPLQKLATWHVGYLKPLKQSNVQRQCTYTFVLIVFREKSSNPNENDCSPDLFVCVDA